MTTQEQKALELALDFVEDVYLGEWRGPTERQEEVITAIKKALVVDNQQLTTEAQQSNEQGCKHCNHPLYCGTKCKNCGKQSNEQVEPVAWVQDVEFEQSPEFAFSWVETRLHNVPLYTHPPVPYVTESRTAQPKPLTDEQIIGIARVTCIGISPHEDTVNLVRAIEAAHSIKE
jgi:hypothetical protein